jgi:hypothetical protein
VKTPKNPESTTTEPEGSEPQDSETSLPQIPTGAPVAIGLPKFDPRKAPRGGGDPPPGPPLLQSYEAIQQKAKGPGIDEWRQVDRARAELVELYQKLSEDERYSSEYKSERAWEAYQAAKEKIEHLAPLSREKMLKSAETAERQSMPMPAEQGLISRDTDKLLLTDNQMMRITRLLERAAREARGPFRQNPTEILKREFARGLREGGPSGGALCRAAVQAAEDFGVDVDTVVHEHRKPHHEQALENAQGLRRLAQMVGSTVPAPPANLQPDTKGTPGVGASGRAPRMFVNPKGAKPIFVRNRPRYWK